MITQLIFFFYYKYEQWLHDKTVPVTEVVQAYDIYETESGGNTGVAGAPSKARLMNIFGTANVDDIIPLILTNGKLMASRTHSGTNKDRSGPFDRVDKLTAKAKTRFDRPAEVHQ
ncbi:hypothetical protein HK102_003451 [Quaeritorhiza haematococci]|nr:hypothetical protein HK102_003451 [Quaeritorhiza haematococci]